MTAARLALAPFVVWMIVRGEFIAGLVLCGIAGLTDSVDGFLARRFGWSSRMGAYLDPVADKALLVGVYVALGMASAVPGWVVGLVLGRDVLILGMAAVGYFALKYRNFAPSFWGKLSTVLQVLTAMLVLAQLDYVVPLGIVLVVLATTWSGADYAWRGIQLLRRLRRLGLEEVPRSSNG